MRLPGDDLIVVADLTSTRAITIDASSDQVWPWIAQLGQGRGGFYSYDRLENLVGCDIHSADRVVPEYQHTKVGDAFKLHPEVALGVAALDPGRSLVVRGGVPMGDVAPPYDFTWAFALEDRTGGTTRLLVRERYAYARWWAPLIVQPTRLVSLVMSRKMLCGIRDRAERIASPGHDHTIIPSGPIDRASSDDLTTLVTDVGSTPMQVGAILHLDPARTLEPQFAAAEIARRIRSVPRLRQRLVPVAWGCGRPVWVDDADFDINEHVRTVSCPAPRNEASLLGLAAEIIGTRLPRDRALWSITLVTGTARGVIAMVIVFHHVLADGIGGLAVLANLVDGAPATDDVGFPKPPPSTRALLADALRTRFQSVIGVPAAICRARTAVAALGPATAIRPTRSSLNRPTGPRREFTVVRTELAHVRDVAHAHSATVNDVVLTAIAGALGELLTARGESVGRFVISVPVSARRSTSARDLGNRVGVVLIDLPANGDPLERLETIAGLTRIAKEAPAAVSTALLGPVFRSLARLGLFGWFIDRQRRVHSFVTNLRGPSEPMTFLDAPIADMVAFAPATGNVTVCFAVLSYAGTISITVIVDPDACPDARVLSEALDRELRRIAVSPDRTSGIIGA